MLLCAGWRVEWRNSFRDFQGVVVRSRNGELEVFEFADQDVHRFRTAQTHIFTICGIAVPELVRYLRSEYTERAGSLANDVDRHNYVVSHVSCVQTDDDKLRLALLAVIDAEKAQLKKAIKLVKQASGSFQGKPSPKQSPKKSPKMSPGKTPKRSSSAAFFAKDAKGESYLDDADTYEDDFEAAGEDEEGEEDYASSEEEDEDEEEESDDHADDDDDEDEDEEGEGEEDSSDEESSDDEDAPRLGLKVFVVPVQDTRGYSMRLTKGGLAKVRAQLLADYGTELKLCARDEEGDVITLRSLSDLKFVYRASKAANKASGVRGQVTLKLFADHSKTPATSAANTVSRDRHPSDCEAPRASVAHTAEGFDVLWKKGDLLGTGSFGKVFGGINLSSGERMAVKEVRFSDDKRSLQQARALQREVQILSSLQHAHIVRYIGTEMSGSTLRIFLEFATDGTLKDALHQFGPFPEPLLRVYTVDILEGLAYLHDLKMIHRDIKPANLLLSHGMVKLADFGCSSGSLFQDASDTETNHHTVVGTTLYMAPEVMQAGEFEDQPDGGPPSPSSSGKRTGYGRKADIWSLGMTLHELSTGSPAFKSAAAAIYAICVSKKLPAFPETFSDVAHHFLSRCLAFDSARRASAVELRAHSFCVRPGLEEARAQTSSMGDSRQVNWSTVKVAMPDGFDFSADAKVDSTGWGNCTGFEGASWADDESRARDSFLHADSKLRAAKDDEGTVMRARPQLSSTDFPSMSKLF